MVKTVKHLLRNQKGVVCRIGSSSSTNFFSNNDPWLILKHLMARSSLVPCDFGWEKVKTIDFSETVVVKVCRRSKLNEYVNLYEY